MMTSDSAKHIQYTEQPHSKEGPRLKFQCVEVRNPVFDSKVSGAGIPQRKSLSFKYFLDFCLLYTK